VIRRHIITLNIVRGASTDANPGPHLYETSRIPKRQNVTRVTMLGQPIRKPLIYEQEHESFRVLHFSSALRQGF